MTKVKKFLKTDLSTFALVILLFIIMQTLSGFSLLSNKMTSLLVPICVYCILAVSLNLTVGILGELSLGHAGFMSIGAFTGAMFTKIVAFYFPNMNSYLRFFIAIVLSVLMAGIFGILIGIPVLRLKGDYLAIVTLAFGEIIKNILQVICIAVDDKGFHFNTVSVSEMTLTENNSTIINGPQGITQIPRNSNFVIAIIMLLLTLVIVLNLIKSRDGRAIMSIRDNVIAAESVGINVTAYKIMAFAISAALAGGAGCLYAHTYSILVSTSFDYNMSILILVYVVLGGIGNIRGSIISAIILTLLPELLRGLSNFRMLIYAIVLIVMMLFNWAPSWIEKREIFLARIKDKFNRSKEVE